MTSLSIKIISGLVVNENNKKDFCNTNSYLQIREVSNYCQENAIFDHLFRPPCQKYNFFNPE